MGPVRIAAVAGTLALAVAGISSASIPNVAFSINVDGSGSGFSAGGAATGTPGVYNYFGTEISGSGTWKVDWNFNAADSSAVNPTFLSGNFTFYNTSNATQQYDILITLPTTPAGPSTLLGGSVAGGLTADADGGNIMSLGGAPMWAAYMDAVQVAGLLAAPINVSAGPFGSTPIGSGAFGQPIPSLAGPAMGNSMSIRFRFELSAGDQASFTSVFVAKVVPAPASLALIGLAGLTGRRRRA